MKKLFLSALSSVCAIISVFTFTACDNSGAINATVLGKPSQKITELSYLERTEKILQTCMKAQNGLRQILLRSRSEISLRIKI